jgi:hypothetical protein
MSKKTKKTTKSAPKIKTPKTTITVEKNCPNCGCINRQYGVLYETLTKEERGRIDTYRYSQTLHRDEEHADLKDCIKHLRSLIEGLNSDLQSHVKIDNPFPDTYYQFHRY